MIKFTEYTGSNVWIDPRDIVAIRDYSDSQAQIFLRLGPSFVVEEMPAEILKHIEEAGRKE